MHGQIYKKDDIVDISRMDTVQKGTPVSVAIAKQTVYNITACLRHHFMSK